MNRLRLIGRITAATIIGLIMIVGAAAIWPNAAAAQHPSPSSSSDPFAALPVSVTYFSSVDGTRYRRRMG